MNKIFKDTLPDPVSVETLRKHFSEVYSLTDSQVEVMLESSSLSVRQALEDVHLLLSDPELEVASLKPFFHGLKGLLLNMGESEWADFARNLEKMAEESQLEDPADVVRILSSGLQSIREYSKEENGS